MLQAIVQWALRYRGVVLALACVLIAYGSWIAAHAKLDVFPDFVPPQVDVQTEAPGLSPEQVETLVTRPIENSLNGLGGQESIRSETIQGLSVITVVFKEGTDVQIARQMLAERLAEVASQLPSGVQSPKLSPLVSSTMDLLKIGLLSERMSPMELRTFADWTIKPRLLAVPGVAKCSVFGGEIRELQIRVHPEALLQRGVAMADVLNAAKGASGVRGGGFVDTKNQRIVLQTEGQLTEAEDIGNVVVLTTASGAPVRLRDVATVVYGPQPKVGDALIMGKPGVLLTMSSQFGANTMDATRLLEKAIDELKPVLDREGVTLYSRLHRPATFIEISLHHIKNSLLLGAGLVAIILLLFLGHIRTALISLTAIPLSLLSAVLVMDHFGVSLNTITLGGLAIAIGEVVDDAIIDVENIVRRLRENRQLAQPLPFADVILSASLEVRSAVVYATFIVICVFIPILTLSGLQGSFFAPLAEAYIIAILSSLVVALTVTPALTLTFFAHHAKDTSAPRLQTLFRSTYESVLRHVARFPAMILVVVVAFLIFALSRLPTLGGAFLPDFREGHFVVGVSTAPGASLEETMRIGKNISAALLANPHIATVEQQIGRAELGEDTWGPHRSEFHIELKPIKGSEEQAVEDDIRRVLVNTPGIQFEILTFLADRIGESISGETSPVVVNLFGENLDELDSAAADVAKVLGTVPGAAEVEVKAPPGAPRIAIRLRAKDLAILGMRSVDALDAIEASYEGVTVAQLYKENEINNVTVVLDEHTRNDPEAVGKLLVSSPTGKQIPLLSIADVYRTEGRFSILHEGARRRQTITCNPTRDVSTFVNDAKKIIAEKVTLPKGMYLEYGGAAEAQSAATRELALHCAIAAVGIILLLSVVLGNGKNVLIVLANLPFALAGGILIVWLAKLFGSTAAGSLTMGSMVGFVTLFGVTTRNSIMLISHYEHLIDVEGQIWNLQTAIRGASERLVPIAMTAIVTALGLLPLALNTNEAGCEIEGPMAVVILGGLMTSTVLNLLILPTLALKWGRFEKAKA